MTTVIIDYDSGNLHSAQKAFALMAQHSNSGPVIVSSNADDIANADRIVLPGDGAFPHCKHELTSRTELFDALTHSVKNRAVPFLGICVGMQMLTTTGYEYEQTQGLGWIDGRVDKVTPSDPSLKIPHMGWNELTLHTKHPVLKGLNHKDHVYFVHSYAMTTTHAHDCIATTDYGGDVTAIVAKDNIIGMQFHPEKSQDKGLKLIENFLKWTP